MAMTYKKDYPDELTAEMHSEFTVSKETRIKLKVSQCFRSFKGAEAFDVLHSLMNTAKKNGQSAFNVIRTIAYPKAMVDDAFLTL